MEFMIVLTAGIFLFLIYCWITNIDGKSILLTFIIITIIILVLIYFCVPEINIKYRIVKENNKYTTLEEVNKILSKEESEYYKIAIMTKPDECNNRTVKYIIKLGKDIYAQLNYKNYIN